MITRAKPEKRDIEGDGHGQDRVTGTGGQDRVTNAPDRVTEIAIAVNEKVRVKNVLCSSLFCGFNYNFCNIFCECF